jgi:hypothetical protein
MPLDLNGNKLFKTSIGPTSEVIKQLSIDGLVMHLDAGNKNSYNTAPIIVGVKIYSSYGGGLRSSNYTVQYSDDNSSWTTAFTGVMSNNTSCGFQTGSGIGLNSVGARRYWRYVEGSAVVSHHPRVSRIILIDSGGAEHTIVRYTSDNCSDTGDYIIGTISYDFATKWTDLSSNGNAGTLTNGPTFNSGNSGYIIFDGTNDYVRTTDVDHGTSEFTLESWVYFNSLSSNPSIIKKNTDNDYWPVFSLSVGSDGKISGYYSSQVYGQCLEGALTSTGIITTGQWYHLCFSKGSAGYTTMKIHRNGVSQSWTNLLYGSHINNVCNSSKPVDLGISYDAPNFIQPLNGRISLTRIYNRQLSDSEVLLNYNAQKSRFGL